MRALRVQHYLKRARDFLEAMKLLQDDLAAFGYSSALLAIHGSMSYSDALRSGLGELSLSSEDHNEAPRKLQRLLAAHQCDGLSGPTRLAGLLGNKTAIAYGSVTVDDAKFKSIVQQAERFAAWAEKTGRELRIEGWRDE